MLTKMMNHSLTQLVFFPHSDELVRCYHNNTLPSDLPSLLDHQILMYYSLRRHLNALGSLYDM